MVVCVYADYKFTQFQAFAKINCCHYPNLSELSELIRIIILIILISSDKFG